MAYNVTWRTFQTYTSFFHHCHPKYLAAEFEVVQNVCWKCYPLKWHYCEAFEYFRLPSLLPPYFITSLLYYFPTLLLPYLRDKLFARVFGDPTRIAQWDLHGNTSLYLFFLLFFGSFPTSVQSGSASYTLRSWKKMKDTHIYQYHRWQLLWIPTNNSKFIFWRMYDIVGFENCWALMSSHCSVCP
jgi:hypothetical protein